jgi:hypothetical protein
LVNAQHVKAVPGRKTDVKDAAWLAKPPNMVRERLMFSSQKMFVTRPLQLRERNIRPTPTIQPLPGKFTGPIGTISPGRLLTMMRSLRRQVVGGRASAARP